MTIEFVSEEAAAQFFVKLLPGVVGYYAGLLFVGMDCNANFLRAFLEPLSDEARDMVAVVVNGLVCEVKEKPSI